VKFSEVSTGFNDNPQTPHVVTLTRTRTISDASSEPTCRFTPTRDCFLNRLLACAPALRRAPRSPPRRPHPHRKGGGNAGVGGSRAPRRPASIPLGLIGSIRRNMPDDGMLFVDVTISEHLAAEHYRVCRPRTYFNPTDNQSMGWSIPASLGAQRIHHGKAVATLTGERVPADVGDGGFSTAAREGLPVKFFVLDDQSYQFMQQLQEPAFVRTTATVLARLNYRAPRGGAGGGVPRDRGSRRVGCEGARRDVPSGAVLVRVVCDYEKRKIRWVDAVRARFIRELTAAQKARFLARLAGARRAVRQAERLRSVPAET